MLQSEVNFKKIENKLRKNMLGYKKILKYDEILSFLEGCQHTVA